MKKTVLFLLLTVLLASVITVSLQTIYIPSAWFIGIPNPMRLVVLGISMQISLKSRI